MCLGVCVSVCGAVITPEPAMGMPMLALTLFTLTLRVRAQVGPERGISPPSEMGLLSLYMASEGETGNPLVSIGVKSIGRR